ncbi:HEAT repeat domain-containing protein [Iningainema tapete]|uniref:HEAT repeat domain-containing protein n=1 Tax=Iningainema tapete TaxID=2806730 RepID=UPI001EE37EBE|nr:HEAT repeat domain-containing protein [Iningainema tapete]
MSEELSAIVQELKNSDPEVRENALDKIGTIKPSNALDIILPFLSDVDPEVRGTAASNLGEIRDSRAVPYLINVARVDSQEKVRADALLALAEYRSSEILDCLVDEVYREKRSRRPRQEVARQLRYYNTESSVNALIVLLQDEDVYVRIPAVDSLKELNRPRLREVWEKAMDDESYYVTEIAREALANLDLFVSTKPI